MNRGGEVCTTFPHQKQKWGVMTLYDYETAIDDLLDEALNELPPRLYEQLLDAIDFMLVDRTDEMLLSRQGQK